MEGEIVNRVANSGIITIDPADFYPQSSQITHIDLKEILWQEAILREKDLRDFLADHDWQQYAGKGVAVFWPAEVIIPKYAAMLIAAKLKPYAALVCFGSPSELAARWAEQQIAELDAEAYRNKIVVVKGCGDVEISDEVYGSLALKLTATVKTLMYGEACSTVPIYKAPRPSKAAAPTS